MHTLDMFSPDLAFSCMLCDLKPWPYSTLLWYTGVCKWSPLFRQILWGNSTRSLEVVLHSQKKMFIMDLTTLSGECHVKKIWMSSILGEENTCSFSARGFLENCFMFVTLLFYSLYLPRIKKVVKLLQKAFRETYWMYARLPKKITIKLLHVKFY